MRIAAALRTAANERTRWPALDGIRGLAIAAVFAYHAFKLAGGWTSARVRAEGVPESGWLLGGGRLGVDLFFVLSGFLLFFSWRAVRDRSPGLGAALRGYAWGRAVRILPPYWVMLAVTVPLLAPELLRSASGLWDLFLFATVQQYNEPALPGRLNVVLWTLTVEVQFYVLLPLVAFLIARARASTAVAVSLLVGLWWFHDRGVYPESLIPGRAGQFVMGMAAASVVAAHLAGHTTRLSNLLSHRATPWLLGGGAAVLWLYHGSTLGLPRHLAIEPYVHPATALAFAGIVAHLALVPRPAGGLRTVLEHPWTRLGGHLSYGIYLWHFPILEHALRARSIVDVPFVGTAAGLVAAAVVSVAVAAVSYAWVERPFLERKVRSSVDRPQRGSQSPSPAGPG